MVTRRMVLKFLQLLLFHRSARRSCQFEMNIGRNFLFKIIDCSAPFNSRNYTKYIIIIRNTSLMEYFKNKYIFIRNIIFVSTMDSFNYYVFCKTNFFFWYFSQKKNRNISILIKIEKLKFKSFDVWKFCFWFYYNAREMMKLDTFEYFV